MPTFDIHPRLRQDCHVLGRLDLSHLLLHRNAAVPWLILVPEVGEGQLHHLQQRDRDRLARECDRIAAFVEERFVCDRVNVAAIGNVVPQLHVHVIGRRADDPCWPGVVWGRLEEGPAWSPQQLADLAAAVPGLRPVP
ncbi:MAG TPA: HIT domain-containing protein [Gammaproteobacteria bacterium]|nr:HIT domain-containing protein [Gammaproteobacteria bacterium]